MAYTAFSNTIFNSAPANTACNKIVEALQSRFTVAVTNANFALSGCAADYFQYATSNREIRVISFILSSQEMYAYLATSIANIINVRTSISYSDRIQITLPENVNLEIWFTNTSLQVIDYYGVTMQTRATIPNGLKNFCPGGIFTGDEAPLQIATLQTFNPGGGALYNTGVKLFPSSLSFKYKQGDNVPASKTVRVKIKNYPVDPLFSNFEDFEVHLSIEGSKGQGLQADFLAATINGATTYELSGNSLSVTTVVGLVNLDVFDGGLYNANVVFEIMAKSKLGAIVQEVDRYQVPVTLTVISDTQSSVEPRSLVFEHVIGEPMPTAKKLSLTNTGQFTLSGPKFYTFLGRSLTDVSSATLTKVSGSGNAEIDVLISRAVEELGVGFHGRNINFFGEDTLAITVIIKIAASRKITVSPSTLYFEATKGVSEAADQILNVTSPIPYTITAPDWLFVYTQDDRLVVDPVNTDSFAAGTYNGSIVLTSDEGSVTVSVVYKINPNGFTDLEQLQMNFTNDSKKVNYASKKSATYIKTTYSGIYYDYDGSRKRFDHITDVPLFNGNGHFFPGVLIGSIMHSIAEIDNFLPSNWSSALLLPFDYYRSASVDMVLEERNLSDDAIVETVYLSDYLFQKGMSPTAFAQSVGVSNTDSPLRVTVNSFAMFNFYRPSGSHTIEVHKNGKLLQRVEHAAGFNGGYGMLLNFAEHKEGDMIQVKLSQANVGSYVRRYIVFPEGKESYHIAWVTLNEQIELMEFTGALSIGSDYTSIENRVYKNLTDITEILEVRKAQRVKADTGWILKDNFPLVDSIARSRRAWLVIKGKYIPMVAQTPKLSNFDSERALYAYELDFKINPEHDYKVYSS